MKSIKVFWLCFSMLGAMGATTFEHNNFAIIASSISTGGTALSSGGNYALSGTIGQHSTYVLCGGEFTLAGGFWERSVPRNGPVLRVTHSGNHILITWPVSQHTVVLQETSDLSKSAVWVLVSEMPVVSAGENRLLIPLVNGTKFYRLVSQAQ